MKTRVEVDDLKRQWKDCGGDFPIVVEGFEDYAEELCAFALAIHADWRRESYETEARRMRDMGLNPKRAAHVVTYQYLLRLELRIAALERSVDDIAHHTDEESEKLFILSHGGKV